MPATATRNDTAIHIDSLTRSFAARDQGEEIVALDDVSVEVQASTFTSVIGPSGCGKSTLFNIIAGLDQPTSGRVEIYGKDATGLIGITGYMLQRDLLLPWRTILDNVILGLEVGGLRKGDAREMALPLLSRYGLGGFEHHYPHELSGGMRQRAALVRTLLYNKDPILLDEPFGALDAQTRASMQEWLLNIWEAEQKTVLFITHDLDEALFLSDVVHVMSARPGRIIERIDVDLPRPRTQAVTSTPEFLAMKERLRTLLYE